MIQVINNVLTEDELTFVDNTLVGDHWGFGYISNDHNKPIWNFDKQLAFPVCNLIVSKLEGYILEDWHINGQTFQLNGSPHQDSYGKCTHAFVYFPHYWEPTWGGGLHIVNEMSIIPERNTGVLFDASKFHYASAPLVAKLRISIGLKLRK